MSSACLLLATTRRLAVRSSGWHRQNLHATLSPGASASHSRQMSRLAFAGADASGCLRTDVAHRPVDSRVRFVGRDPMFLAVTIYLGKDLIIFLTYFTSSAKSVTL